MAVIVSSMLAMNHSYAAESANTDLLVGENRMFSEQTLFPISGFEFEGNINMETDELQKITAPFIGPRRGAASLVEAKNAILKRYQDQGVSMVAVILPKNIALDGIVHFKIIEVKVGGISIVGNKYFSDKQILSALPELQKGKSINFKKLSRQLYLANDNPSRNIRLNFKGNNENGETDVEIQVQDKKPEMFGISFDNTGSDETGNTRINTFMLDSNMNNRGDLFSASYITSPSKMDDVKQFGIYYQLPIAATGDKINITGTYSNVDSGKILNILDVSGQGTGMGIHYVHYLDRSITSKRYIDFGIDQAKYNNNLMFFGTNLGVDVSINPVSLEYGYVDNTQTENRFFDISYVHNIPGGENNNTETYAMCRNGAAADYDLWRFHAGYQKTVPTGWTFNISTEGQYSNCNLISNEQFELGGENSIRGFREREILSDQGLKISTEIYTPAKNSQRYVLFWDQGLAKNVDDKSNYYSSIGFGWRYSNKNISQKIDLGYVLNAEDTKTVVGDMKLHYLFTYCY